MDESDGGGILPITFHNSQIYLLLGQEAKVNGWNESLMWSDFGGHRKKNETILQGSCREASEELMGILGTPEEIMKHSRTHTHQVIHDPQHKYTCYVVNWPWTNKLEQLPIVFNKLRTTSLQRKNVPKEFLEKSQIKWIPLHTNWNQTNIRLRPGFLNILKKLI